LAVSEYRGEGLLHTIQVDGDLRTKYLAWRAIVKQYTSNLLTMRKICRLLFLALLVRCRSRAKADISLGFGRTIFHTNWLGDLISIRERTGEVNSSLKDPASGISTLLPLVSLGLLARELSVMAPSAQRRS